MDGDGNSVFGGVAYPVGKLIRVEWRREAGLDVVLNQPLKAFHYRQGERYRSVVVNTHPSSMLQWWTSVIV